MAFLSADLVESSDATAARQDEPLDDGRAGYISTLRRLVAARGGREIVRDRNQLTIAFESASEAVACAATVQRAFRRHNRSGGDRLDVRMGIQIGESIESNLPQDDDGARGPALQAMRLCDSALGGQILVSDLVSAIAPPKSSWTFERVGLREIKELPEPISTFEVVLRDSKTGQLPPPPELGGLPAGRTPFVGRRSELERLQKIWTAAVAGERRAAFASGEPGMGKSRLAAEFALSAHRAGAVVLWGRSFEEAVVPYQPFVEALRHYVTYSNVGELRSQLGADPSPLTRLVPELPTRLPGVSPPSNEGESERYRLFETVSALLSAISTGSPLLLVLDDLQWCDQGTLLLLKHVALDTRPASLLVLGLYRGNEVPPAHPLARLQADVEKELPLERIELGGFAEPEVATMLEALTGWSPPVEVARSLRNRTEGNPFYLQELIHQLSELGLTDPGRMASAALTIRTLRLPTRVRQLIVRRLQRLSGPALGVLEAAAIVGMEFDLDVLGAVTSIQGDRLIELLDEAVESGLIVEAADRTGVYGFSHALIHQALYEVHSANHRAAMHRRAGEAIERLRPGNPDEWAELARHFALAGSRYTEKVVTYGSAAGDRALDQLAYEDAIVEFRRALESLAALRPDDPDARGRLLVRLGMAQTRAGDAPGARSSFREAAEISTATTSSSTLASAALGYGGTAGFGGVWETVGRVDEVLVGYLERALATLADGDEVMQVRLRGRLAQALYWSADQHRALALSQAALDSARALGDPAAIAYALDSRHVALLGPDHLAELRRVAEEMLALGRALGDRDIQLEGYSWAISDALATDPMEVVDAYIEARARLAAELHQPYHIWFTEATRAMRAHVEGRYEDMARLAQAAWEQGQQAHGENALQTYLVQTLLLRMETGRLDDLIDDLRAYVPQSPLEAWKAALALAYAMLDRREEALAGVSEFAVDSFTRIRRDCLWFATLSFLSQVVARFDAAEYAEPLYDLLNPYAENDCPVGGAVLWLGPVSWLLGMLSRTMGDYDRALRDLERALDRCRRVGSPPFAARVELEMARTLLARHAAGDRGRAEKLIADARRVAHELGMRGLAEDLEKLESLASRVPAGMERVR